MDVITLSPVTLFVQAGIVGKTVMGGLGAASGWCWVLILEGVFEAGRLSRAVETVRAGGAAKSLSAVEDAGRSAAMRVLRGESNGERATRIARAMSLASRMAISRKTRGLSNLAVIASVAPFVGLFGTVWGIMTSFASIADAKDTSLAVVAPGIAEALAATAYGLAAAIPASIAYNWLGAAFAQLGQPLAIWTNERADALAAEAADAGEAA